MICIYIFIILIILIIFNFFKQKTIVKGGFIEDAENGHTYISTINNKKQVRIKRDLIVDGDITFNGNLNKNGNKFINYIYPVESIYISTSSVNPGNFWIGTKWVSFGAGRTLVGVDTTDTDFNSSGKIGGEKNHTLTLTEMPIHSHSDNYNWYSSTEVSGGIQYTNGRNYSHFYQTNGSSAGGNASHNNMQPFIVTYMWKRKS